MNNETIWSGWKLAKPTKMATDGQETRRYQRTMGQYKSLLATLETLDNLVPGALNGQHGLAFPDEAITGVFEELHRTASPKALKIAHNLLVKGLERGHAKLKWHVTIPSPLVTVTRKPPTVTTHSFSELHPWDDLVEAHEAMPNSKGFNGDALHKWLTGRWLFQLIREGALMNRHGLEQIPDAFERGITFFPGSGFLTLEECIQSSNKEDKDEKDEGEEKDGETSADDSSSTSTLVPSIEKEQRFRYRRLFLSPVSQLLLLNTYQAIGKAWPRTASKSIVPVEQCLMFYVKNIADDAPPASFSALLSMAKTSAALEMSPLLTHYASKADISLSLRPSSWQRLLQRKVLTATSVKTDDDEVYLDFQAPNQTRTTVSDQLKQLRQLQRCFSASLVGQTGRHEATNNIEAFLVVSNNNGAMVTLLAKWCQKLMQKGGRVKSKLVARSAATYLSTIARPLVAHSQEFGDIQSASADEWQALYDNVLNSAKSPGMRAKMQNRLSDFHHFLVDTLALPNIDFEYIGGTKQRVDVNIITPAEFHRAMTLIEKSDQPARFRTMQKLALILGYRLGLRRSESASLLIRDIAYLPDHDEVQGEVIIRANQYRRGKSYSATRRLPLWLLMPEERKSLIQWTQQRRGEATTQAVEKQLLFCRSGSGYLLLDDKELFRPIQTALKTVSGDDSLRYHHLRHSFVTFTLLRLLEQAPGELLPRAWILDDNRNVAMPNADADISALAGLAPQGRPSRKRLWQLALWAGHASPDETLSSYTHLLDWALGQALRERFNPMLSIDTQFALLNLPSKTALSSWRNRCGLKGQTQASELLQYLKDDWQNYLAADLFEKEWHSYQAPTHNPLDNPLEAAFDWPEATTIYQSMRLVEQQEICDVPFVDAIHQAARRFVLDPEQLHLLIENGEALMQRKTRRSNQQFSREDNRNDRLRRVASKSIYMPELRRCMAPPIKPPVLREAGQFFHRLLDWHQSQPVIAEESLITLRKHMQRSIGHIVLPDAKAINRVRELLRPLRCFQHVYLVVEVEATAKEKRIKQHWSKATDIPHKRINLMPTPTPSGRTRHWYGNANLKITRGNYKDTQQPLWEAVRFAAFMAILVLGLDK